MAALFAAIASGVTGISVFALGLTFDYLVSLFYKRPFRQGLLGRPLFNPSIGHHFGWLGLVGLIAGIGLAITRIALGVHGREIARLWLYLLGSAMCVLVGMQLINYWPLMRVLDDLSRREALTRQDLGVQASRSWLPYLPMDRARE